MNLIIDGSNLLHRAFWVAETREPLVNTKNVWTGPLFIFLKSVKSLSEKFEPDNIWLTWDKRHKHNIINFRKQLLPEVYKQNRNVEKNQKVHKQQAVVEEWLKALGVYQLYPYVLEADDVISWLTLKKVSPSIIVSMDKDLLQLVNGNTQFYNPLKKTLININNFEQETETPLSDFLNVKALMGDKSDNVEGVTGYGPQKSKKLASQGRDVILSTLNEEDRAVFLKNYTIMNLHDSYQHEVGEVEHYEEQYATQIKENLPDMKSFIKLCEEYEMNSFIKDIDNWKRIFTRQQTLSRLILQLT